MSNMYSLLNYIAATSQEVQSGSGVSPFASASSLVHNGDESMTYSAKSGLQGLSEDQKRLIGISTISVVTRLALEFKSDEVRQVESLSESCL